MKSYYETLGLMPGASQQEIKKAYFKMLRRYPPESDPERFQLIRKAYEQLKINAAGGGEPVFAPNSDPEASRLMEQIEQYSKMKDYGACREIGEKACGLFPEDLQFLYMLVKILRKCGNTGKAVKKAELLVEKEPENKWFLRELAFSYDERGYSKKAMGACEKAYGLGCRDTEFLLMYSLQCNSNRKYSQGVEVLMGLVGQEKRWRKEEISGMVEAYIGLLSMEPYTKTGMYPEILSRLYKDLKQYHIYMPGYVMQIAAMLMHLCMKHGYCHQACFQSLQIFSMLKELCLPEDDTRFFDMSEDELRYQSISNDERLDELFRIAYEAFVYGGEEDEAIRKFSVADAELCMLAKRDVVISQAEIVRQEYPYLYERLGEFLQKLESGRNLNILKDSLFKTYCRYEAYISGGYYFEKYPEEKVRARGRMVYSGDDEGVYVREFRKVGRNELCPCGSGKKYKHCCMKK